MNPTLRDWLCQQLRPLVDVRFCAPLAPAPGIVPALRIGLWTGVFIHVHSLSHAPNPRQLRRTLQHDEEAGCATLFLLDAALAPAPEQSLSPPEWMLALHELGHERLLVGAAPGQTPGLRPAHLEPLSGARRFAALYGPALHPRRLHAGRVNIRRRSVRGFWNLAHFGAEVFWQRKERQRFANARHFDGATDAQRVNAPPASAEVRLAQCYALLGLKPQAAREEAREAFRRQAFDLHPDVSALPTQLAEERFRALSEAWEHIRNVRGWN